MDKQRVFLWAGASILLFLLITQTSLVSTLFALFVLGVLPGTQFVIPAWIILIVYPCLFVTGIVWLRTQPLFIGEKARPVQPAPVHKTPKVTKATSPAKRARTTKRRVRATV